ncbi:hypothetical protein DRW03_15080 [Corallococcus sp. H22C18031201]|nr:hypothetical protein DRW03_15080 [Corallococcus sp. H22C18031201]
MPHPRSAAALVVLALLLLGTSAPAAQRPLRVRSITRVVEAWKESQHLYVKGDVGASDEQLRELEVWLSQEAPHWTVVLSNDAEQERFTDASGSRFEGIEAAKQALGKGLSNRTSFGALRHPDTGEQDGAIFLLSLRERNLSYFGSDAMDKRGLGEAHWQGNLDASAIAAMRSGGRVLDAARDTVTTIQGRLAQQLQKEREARRAELDAVRGSLQELGAALDTLGARHRTLFEGHPPEGVRQANPDLGGMRTRLVEALGHLEPEARANPEAAKALQAELREALSRASQGLTEYTEALTQQRQREAELAPLLAHPLQPMLLPEVEDARGEVEAARVAVVSLAPDYAKRLESAATRLNAASTLLDTLVTRQKRLQELPEQVEALSRRPLASVAQAPLSTTREAQRQARTAFEHQDRATFLQELARADAALESAQGAIGHAEAMRALRNLVIFIATVSAMGLLIRARRRRNRHRAEALTLLSQWRTALDEKTQALFGMLERTHLVAGTSQEDIRARFEGITQARALKLASDVDELFLLSVAATRVLSSAEEHLEARGAWGLLAAHLTTGPYVRAVSLLRDQPIAFEPDDGVEWVLRGGRTQTQKLLGSVSSYQPFSLSFAALVEAFNGRAGSAADALEALETSTERTQESVSAMERVLAELSALAALGSVLHVASLQSRVTPALEKLLGQARPLLAKDPLAALEGPLTEARRPREDADALHAALKQGHGELLPVTAQAATALGGLGLAGAWLDAGLAALARQAEEIASVLVKRDVSADIQALTVAMERLRDRSAQAEALAGEAVRVKVELDRSAQGVDSARTELGRALGLPASAMLREKDENPSGRLSAGEAALAQAHAGLGSGELGPVREHLDTAQARVTDADAMVAKSREAEARYASRLHAARALLGDMKAQRAEHEAHLGSTLPRYQPAALRLRAGDPTHPHANGTVHDNLQEATACWGQAQEALDAAPPAHDQGHLLEADALLGQVEGCCALVKHRLTELAEKLQQLAALEVRNTEQLAVTEQLAQQCLAIATDRRTSASTISHITRAQQDLTHTRDAVHARPAEPFAAAEQLSTVGQALLQLRQRAKANHEEHTRVETSLRLTRKAVENAEGLARKAARDGIADSVATTGARASVEALATALARADATLLEDHGDWEALHAEGDRIAEAATKASAVLTREMQAAKDAQEAVNQATQEVRRASRWSGGYGVTLTGDTGNPSLTSARTALNAGDYRRATTDARRAERQAQEAIAEAERIVEHHRRAEAARREEEQRHREEEEARRQSEERHRRQMASAHTSQFSWSSSSSSSSSSDDSGFSSSSWSSDGGGGGGSDDNSSSSGGGSGFSSSTW